MANKDIDKKASGRFCLNPEEMGKGKVSAAGKSALKAFHSTKSTTTNKKK